MAKTAKRDALIREVSQIPDPYIDEILDFVRFLRHRIVRDAFDTAVVSESALAKDWLGPEEDEAWKDL